MKNINSKHITVLGSGNFGTCLAQHIAEQGYAVKLLTRSKETVDSINQHHKNPKYLSSIKLSPRLKATNVIDANLFNNSLAVVQAIPSQSMREILTKIKPFISSDNIIICAAKGIELNSLKLPHQIITECLGKEAGNNSVVLSGPSFAIEVANRQPTCVSVASFNKKSSSLAQEIFHAAHFRVYTSEDPIGLEISGALKNVIAIAAGATAGIGYKNNSRAALITRGLHEITSIGLELGANPLTFLGLGGVGDLFLTCSSEQSRNYRTGYQLGCGKNLKETLNEIGSIAEGIDTAKSAYELVGKLGINAPIISTVYEVLYNDKPITAAVTELITREAKAEFSN